MSDDGYRIEGVSQFHDGTNRWWYLTAPDGSPVGKPGNRGYNRTARNLPWRTLTLAQSAADRHSAGRK